MIIQDTVCTNDIGCGVVFYTVQTVASDEHPLEILLESASEGRMAKLILRDNLTGSIDVSHCVHCILAGFLSGEAGGAFAPPWIWLAPS